MQWIDAIEFLVVVTGSSRQALYDEQTRVNGIIKSFAKQPTHYNSNMIENGKILKGLLKLCNLKCTLTNPHHLD